jgi:hypothetical protein
MSRRKRPKNTPLEVRALALRPPSVARVEEIVEELVDQLRPWKFGEAAIIKAVNINLTHVLILAPLEARRCADHATNRAHARKLERALVTIEELLTTAPIPLSQFLLDPYPTMTADGGFIPLEEISLVNEDRAKSFRSELKRMQEVCTRAINDGLGHHPNYDPVKRFCAMFAVGIMEILSKRTATTTNDGAFRAIASLLYEAVSGKRDADLKRACDAELRDVRARKSIDTKRNTARTCS